MRAIAIPRFDVGAAGVHLAWNGPEGLPVSDQGYDVQRRPFAAKRRRKVCEKWDDQRLKELKVRFELPGKFGRLYFAMGAEVEVFRLVLDKPTDRVEVSGAVQAVIAFALREGKVVKTASGAGAPFSLVLESPTLIDQVVLYAEVLRLLEICVRVVDVAADAAEWKNVPFLVKGLTLPLRETQVSLVTPLDEWDEGKKRLAGNETYTQNEHIRLAKVLKEPLKHPELGRPADRIVLLRATDDQPFEEIGLDTELTLLTIPARLRRVLGFGWYDKKGLVQNQTYEYRITGRFRAEDLYDEVYDFRAVPSGTKLPGGFRIRGLSFSLAEPAQMIVLHPEPAADDLVAVARRGLRLEAKPPDPAWKMPSFDDWALTIDFPKPLKEVVLELSGESSFEYAAGFGSLLFDPAQPVPQGTTVKLTFPQSAMRMALRGAGVLFALRIPDGRTGFEARSVETGPVTFAPQPLPAPPPSFVITNLQQPPVIISGTVDESTKVPSRPQPGFSLEWTPATPANVPWPDDLDAAPPIDAGTFHIEHRRVGTPQWQALFGGDNLTIGSRDAGPGVELSWGRDLDEVFPPRKKHEPGGPLSMRVNDVFGVKDPDPAAPVRPNPPLGTFHEYQIRAVDPVGRIGPWKTSNSARLEKWIPPPVPAAVAPAGDLPPGPRARVLVKGDPYLTAADLQILGDHDDAVILEWAWRQEERDLDPLAAEFRLYRWSLPPDTIPGNITAVADFPATESWDVTFVTNRTLVADECKGQWLASGGHPFLITSHPGGKNVVVRVKKSAVKPGLQPVKGAALFGRPLRPEHQRPKSWDQRVAVVPITQAVNYTHTFFDVLSLSVANFRNTIWVGVSAADAESYVPDEVPGGNRPGNESSIAIAAASGRHHGKPSFSAAPPIGDVPEIRAEEPTGRDVVVALNLPQLLVSKPQIGTPIALDRCAFDDILSIASVTAQQQIQLRMQDGTQQIIDIPNDGDRQAIATALQSANPERLASKYLLYLATHHPKPEEIFLRASGRTEVFGKVTDRIPSKAARYAYRVRVADANGNVGSGGAILHCVVRVPSNAPAALPRRSSLASTGGSVQLGVHVPDDWDTTRLLVFHRLVPFGQKAEARADLLRVPNRTDVLPRLRTAAGVLAPEVHDLPAGNGAVTVTMTPSGNGWVQCWIATLTRDGVPSELVGPFSAGVGS